jgi:hypothetical protein
VGGDHPGGAHWTLRLASRLPVAKMVAIPRVRP